MYLLISCAIGLDQIITNPMDLGTIARKLAKEGSGGYLDHRDFAADVQLVFDNAMKYNGQVTAFLLSIVFLLQF